MTSLLASVGGCKGQHIQSAFPAVLAPQRNRFKETVSKATSRTCHLKQGYTPIRTVRAASHSITYKVYLLVAQHVQKGNEYQSRD